MTISPNARFCMAAEWQPHAATWIAWPHEAEDWPGKFAAIPWVYAEIVRHLHQAEPVHIEVDDESAERRARAVLRRNGVDLKRVQFHHYPTDRVWTRDHGPIFVQAAGEDGLTVLDWRFNGWAKYNNWKKDDAIPARIARDRKLPHVQPTWQGKRVVLEGGSIDVNGAGLLLTTEECLLSTVQQRNPGMERSDYEAIFREYLGIERTIWLGQGIVGDDTHGHVDDLARFANDHTIVVAREPNPFDPNYRPLEENWERLQGLHTLAGRNIDVIALPMPEPVVFAGQRLPASYANFYIANDRVLVPTFNDPHDRKALGLLGELFRDRKVVGIHAVDLVWGLGTLHCLTQQEPLPVPARRS